MGRFDEKFDRDTKDAVATYACDLKDNGIFAYVKQTRNALKEGRIPHTPAQDMSTGYIALLCQREQRKRRGLELSHVAKMPPSEAKEELRKRVISLIDRTTKHFEEANKAPEPDEALKLIKMWRELDAMGEGKEPHKNRKRLNSAHRATHDKHQEPASDTVRRMVQAHHSRELGHSEEKAAA
jgi:hypothetical protein